MSTFERIQFGMSTKNPINDKRRRKKRRVALTTRRFMQDEQTLGTAMLQSIARFRQFALANRFTWQGIAQREPFLLLESLKLVMI